MRKNLFFGKTLCSSWSLMNFKPIFFRTLAKKVSTVVHTAFSVSTVSVCTIKTLFGKNNFFVIFVTLVKDLWLLLKKFQPCRHNLFLAVQRTVMRKTGFLEKINFFNLFRTLTKNISSSRQKKFVRVLKRAFNVSRGTFRGCFMEKEASTFFCRLRNMSNIISDFWRKLFSRVIKTAFYVYRGPFQCIFWKRRFIFIIFRLYLRKLIQLLAEKCWQAHQKTKLFLQGRNMCEKFFEEGKFSIIFGLWAKAFWISVAKNLVGLWKMQSGCPGEHFEKQLLFWQENMFFLIVFGLRPLFLILWREYFSMVVQIAFYLSSGRVWAKKKFWESIILIYFVTLVNNLALRAKNFQKCRHTWFLGIQRNELGKKILWKF